ncbi:MAG: NUDIX hydrolase, partial [Aeromicrobium sp.]
EAREESGIEDLVLAPAPARLYRHAVRCRLGDRVDDLDHLDVQFVAVAPEDAVHVISDESDDLAWFDVDDLPAETDQSVRDLIAAATTRLRGTP